MIKSMKKCQYSAKISKSVQHHRIQPNTKSTQKYHNESKGRSYKYSNHADSHKEIKTSNENKQNRCHPKFYKFLQLVCSAQGSCQFAFKKGLKLNEIMADKLGYEAFKADCKSCVLCYKTENTLLLDMCN